MEVSMEQLISPITCLCGLFTGESKANLQEGISLDAFKEVLLPAVFPMPPKSAFNKESAEIQ